MAFHIPTHVSGRPVTNRGVHLHPGKYHGYWCGNVERRTMILDMLESMSMSWVVILTGGDSVLEVFDGKAPVEWLLDRGIIPIVRDHAKLPRAFENMATVNRLATIYQRYNVPLLFKLWNEPQDDREWVSETAPDGWWGKFIGRWNAAAPLVVQNGGYPGFPDGPGYDFTEAHPFRDTDALLWDDGLAWYGVHPYGKGRPLNYPYDDVSQHGTKLTVNRRNWALDDYAGHPAWTGPPLDEVNEQRGRWATPGKTILHDDTCWWAWKKVDHYARETLGHPVPMAVVEGGFVPRDRPGGGPNTDYRWPHTTPKMVARKTLAMFEEDNPLFAICPWLLADDEMGHGGWPFDAWYGWAYRDKYGLEKPVIQTLRDNPPDTQGPTATDKITEARGVLNEALEAMTT